MEMRTNRYTFCNQCGCCGNGFYGTYCGYVEEACPSSGFAAPAFLSPSGCAVGNACGGLTEVCGPSDGCEVQTAGFDPAAFHNGCSCRCGC